MATNKDVVKAALAGAIATHGVDYVVNHWEDIVAAIMRALSAVS